MYGAILGDIIGCPYEFDRGNKTKDFPLFSAESNFTDDSVMTLAVAKAFLDAGLDADDETVFRTLEETLHEVGLRHPHAGYGSMFSRWLFLEGYEPYNSFGNGSAMRVSSVAWLFDDLPSVRRAARLSAAVTHNHPEGIKGAESVAAAIYLARTGKSKSEIKAYIEEEFGYDLSRTCDEIRPDYCHEESCQKTVPEAITAFLEGEDFEDVIRTAVSLGGDCDTLTAIAGSMAEGFYGVPEELKEIARSYLTDDLLGILDEFEAAIGTRTKKSQLTEEEKDLICILRELNADTEMMIGVLTMLAQDEETKTANITKLLDYCVAKGKYLKEQDVIKKCTQICLPIEQYLPCGMYVQYLGDTTEELVSQQLYEVIVSYRHDREFLLENELGEEKIFSASDFQIMLVTEIEYCAAEDEDGTIEVAEGFEDGNRYVVKEKKGGKYLCENGLECWVCDGIPTKATPAPPKQILPFRHADGALHCLRNAVEFGQTRGLEDRLSPDVLYLSQDSGKQFHTSGVALAYIQDTAMWHLDHNVFLDCAFATVTASLEGNRFDVGQRCMPVYKNGHCISVFFVTEENGVINGIYNLKERYEFKLDEP